MKSIVIRIVAFFLVPFLVADPNFAAVVPIARLNNLSIIPIETQALEPELLASGKRAIQETRLSPTVHGMDPALWPAMTLGPQLFRTGARHLNRPDDSVGSADPAPPAAAPAERLPDEAPKQGPSRLVHIVTGRHVKGTIQLKEYERFAVDGSVLMRWHQRDTLDGKVRELDYTTAFMPGYKGVGSFVDQADGAEQAWRFFNYRQELDGAKIIAQYIDAASPTLLLPLQAGVCIYNCLFCPFARDAIETRGKKIKQLRVEEIKTLVLESFRVAAELGVSLENIGVAFVGSGDATPNTHLKNILGMLMHRDFRRIARIRVSTVAGKVAGEFLTPMQIISQILENEKYTGRPTLSVQVSAHSMDEGLRALHVYGQEFTSEAVVKGERIFTAEDAMDLLLPLKKVAEQFERIVQVQKDWKTPRNRIRIPSLTFVCSNKTVIKARDIAAHGFNPGNTVIQLRPLLSDIPEYRMVKGQFLEIYHDLKQNGFKIILMPPSPSGVELRAERAAA